MGLIVRAAGESHPDQYWIDGDASEEKYFQISGYYGKHGPHVFAAAPELMEALELALEYIQSCPDQISASGQVARDTARTAIAKAKGETA